MSWLESVQGAFGGAFTHYRVIPEMGAIEFFNVDKCETCNMEVLPTNHPVLMKFPGSAIKEVLAADDSGELTQSLKLPVQGYYDDDTDKEVCDNCID